MHLIINRMFEQKYESMNLPVNNHIDKLLHIVNQLQFEVDSSQKQLHILRGSITQLSYMNKQADLELNQYLVGSMSSLKSSWQSQWYNQQNQLNDYKKKLIKGSTEQQDIEYKEEQLHTRVEALTQKVGLT